MKNKIVIMFCILLSACSTQNEGKIENTKNVEVVEAENILSAKNIFTFKFPNHWKESEEEHPFDLQAYSKSELITSVFVYDKNDIGEDGGLIDILKLQINDLEEKREAFDFLKEKSFVTDDGKEILTYVYNVEENLLKYSFVFSYVDIKDCDYFPVVIQTCLASEYENYENEFEEILVSCEYKS